MKPPNVEPYAAKRAVPVRPSTTTGMHSQFFAPSGRGPSFCSGRTLGISRILRDECRETTLRLHASRVTRRQISVVVDTASLNRMGTDSSLKELHSETRLQKHRPGRTFKSAFGWKENRVGGFQSRPGRRGEDTTGTRTPTPQPSSP
jgi:hypothetical protein